MSELILRIYDWLRCHRLLRWLSLGVLTVVLALLLTRQTYQEDISDFLPLNSRYQHDLQLFQQTSGADRIVVLFRYHDVAQTNADTLVQAVRHFTEGIGDGSQFSMMSELDLEQVSQAMDFVYSYIPFFLTARDYEHFDSLLADPGFVARQVANDKQSLLFPVAGLWQENFQRDPLNLFSPVVSRQQTGTLPFESYDGHIFTPDMQQALVLLRSPYGASETEHNAELTDLLQHTADSTMQTFPQVDVRFLGGPVIAVGNARQIKTDSLLAISLAVVLIVILLFIVFRRTWPLLLIVLSIAWGWLFAMGALAVIHDSVSVIVIGISSVIMGIAVNYPLHLIAHLQHASNVRDALKEIVMPLVVGNITTVGAFLALVPLESVALRDLGLFSSLLLIGTILFVLLYLPHLIPQGSNIKHHPSSIIHHTSSIIHHPSPTIVVVIVGLTLIFAWFSLQTSFDDNMNHINYLTSQQREDMAYFQQLMPQVEHPAEGMVYVLKEDGQRFCSPREQTQCLQRWNDFTARHADHLQQQVAEAARKEGFAPDTFDDFSELLTTRYAPLPVDSFDIRSVQTSIATRLSDDFNYIGWVCGCIVFFFLWFSLGSIELALLSFLPMAVSWIWILGIMAILGIQFNVVNVILATFIFGQGDDYTIFMTEGCQYEYAYRKKMLASYKHSIILSALIMFIGIGTLILAKHPALRSLAEVTIVGMFSVVLMAFLFPPLIFRWLVYDRQGRERTVPITLRHWKGSKLSTPLAKERGAGGEATLVALRYRYRGVEISTAVNRRLRYLRRHPEELEQLLTPSSHLSPLTTHHSLEDAGWGETALLVAMQHPDQQFVALVKDEDHLLVARHAAENIVHNLTIQIKP